ncbi:hypothetical protein Hanom_Chr01g00089891 [Helianthus anomalus]
MCCCRYHCDVADQRLAQHIDKGNEEGLLICSVAFCSNLWALIMDSCTGITSQVYQLSPSFLNKWINYKWRERFHITAMATARTRWEIVMSRGAGFSDQVVELDLLYPSKGIHKRWDVGYRITLAASTSNQAAFVLSIREENLHMIHRTHFALLCFLAHMSRLSFMFCFLPFITCMVSLLLHFVGGL